MSIDFHHIISLYICQNLVCFAHNFAQFKVTVPMFELSTLSTLWPAPCHRKMMSIVSMHLELHNVPNVSIFSFLHIEMEIFFNISSNLVLLSAHEICLRYIIPRPLRPGSCTASGDIQEFKWPHAARKIYLESFKRRFAKVSQSRRRTYLLGPFPVWKWLLPSWLRRLWNLREGSLSAPPLTRYI